MSSFFYEDRFNRILPLTGLFMERLGVKVEEAGGLNETNLMPVITSCIKECELVEGEVEEKHVLEVISRLKELESESDQDGKKPGSNKTGKGRFFAGYLTDWATKLNYVQLCLYAANFDYQKAREYFEKRDQQSIIALAHDKLRLDFEMARVSFEAALFGFGGKYKDTPGEGDIEIDLTEGGERANRAFESLTKGFF